MATTLILTNDFPPRIGGIESFVEAICGLLDHDVVVYTSGPPGAAVTDRTRPYPMIRSGSLLLPTPRTRSRVIQAFADHGCRRVVFGSAVPLGWLAGPLRAAGADRIVALTHGHERGWAALPGPRQVLNRIGAECDALTTISAFTAAELSARLSEPARSRLSPLPPPVDTDVFLPAATRPAGPVRCVAVGRFVPQKGLGSLLRAWRRVLDERGPRRPAELVLVGAGPLRVRLERAAVDLGLTGSVRFTGALDRAGVVAELQRATVFALPVRTRFVGLYAEGLGLAALEAAACGLPVVVGRSGGAPETVQPGRTGYVVDPHDPVELADRISQLLNDPAAARALGRAGRERVVRTYGGPATRWRLRALLELDIGLRSCPSRPESI